MNRRDFLTGTAAATAVSHVDLSSAWAQRSFALTNELANSPFPFETTSAAFRLAKPIWPRGRDREMNLFVGFRAVFDVPAGKQVFF
jgi:hypothetical protein